MSDTTDPRPPVPGDPPPPESPGLPQDFAASLKPSDFNTAMVHLYRGEVSRSNTWRGRLDATTNWAVVTTGAALSFAFGGAGNPPVVILIVTLLVLIFLFIEARRYRYYELWMHRARLLETNYFTGLLSPTLRPRGGWADRMTESLLRPAFPITLLEALGRRYRRNYAPIFLILAFSWVAAVYFHPDELVRWADFLTRAAIGPLPGWLVIAIGFLFNGALISLGIFTVGLRQTDAEVFGKLPRGPLRLLARLRIATREALEVDLAAFKPGRGAGRKRLALIISDKGAELGPPLLEKLDRGVTLIKGTGMYSGREHGILMCVVQRRESEALRAIVLRHDPTAFVVFMGAEDVRGEGFRPLEAS